LVLQLGCHRELPFLELPMESLGSDLSDAHLYPAHAHRGSTGSNCSRDPRRMGGRLGPTFRSRKTSGDRPLQRAAPQPIHVEGGAAQEGDMGEGVRSTEHTQEELALHNRCGRDSRTSIQLVDRVEGVQPCVRTSDRSLCCRTLTGMRSQVEFR